MRGLVALVAFLVTGALAGCMDDAAPTVPTETDAAFATKERFFGAQVEGPQSIQTRFVLDGDTACSFAGFAHHPLHLGFLPDLVWGLDRFEDDGTLTSVAGGIIPVPYPQSRVHAGPFDSRPITAPVTSTVWDTYFAVAFGEQTDFVTWSGYRDFDLAAGRYQLTAYSPTAFPASGNDLLGDSSLGTGLQCQDPFRILSESYGTPSVLLTPYGVQGDLDIGTEVFGPEIHQGSLHFTATGDQTMLWTEGARLLGEVAYKGPASERLSMDHLDAPNVNLARQPFPQYWRWLPAGDYEVSWDLNGPATMYWMLGLCSYHLAPPEWGMDGWVRPY